MAAARGKMVDIRVGGTGASPVLRVGFIVNVNVDGSADICCPDFIETGDEMVRESKATTSMQIVGVRMAKRSVEGRSLGQWREIT